MSTRAVPVASICFIGNLGQILRVVNRNLPNAAGPCDRQLPSRSGVTGKQVRHRVASLSAGVPGLEDGSYMLRSPRDVEGPAVQQDKDNRLADCNRGFEQLLLPAG